MIYVHFLFITRTRTRTRTRAHSSRNMFCWIFTDHIEVFRKAVVEKVEISQDGSTLHALFPWLWLVFVPSRYCVDN